MSTKKKKITLLEEKINKTRDQLLCRLIQTQQNKYLVPLHGAHTGLFGERQREVRELN